MPSTTTLLRAVRGDGLDAGRAPLALRAAVAAALAWLAVLPLGGLADEYPYYAPFGAVIAVTGSVAISFTSSVRAVVAILLGSAIAIAVASTPLPEVVSLALAVGLGTLLAGWSPVRPMASWVPLACVFVLELGGATPWEFATAYFALTGLGALVGTAVDLLYPALPWQHTDARLTELRERLAAELEEMADAIGADEPPSPEALAAGPASVVAQSVEVDRSVEESVAYRRANWRARGWWHVPDEQLERAATLQHVALLVRDLRTLLQAHESREVSSPALGEGLRWPAATAMRAVAHALRSAADADEQDWSEEHRAHLDDAVRAIRALEDGVRSKRDAGSDLFAAASTVTTLWRVVSTLTPAPLRDDLLPGW